MTWEERRKALVKYVTLRADGALGLDADEIVEIVQATLTFAEENLTETEPYATREIEALRQAYRSMGYLLEEE